MNSRNKNRGFTLVELVIVIIILGVLSVGLSNFVGFGSRIYLDVSNRDELIASARFAIERLNRELRQALPNSIRTDVNGRCVEFVPVVASASYTDIPAVPENAQQTFSAIGFSDRVLPAGNLYSTVYVMQPAHVYNAASGRRFQLSGLSGYGAIGNLAPWTFEFANAIRFATESPTKRVFVVAQPISYCLNAGQLRRIESYGFNTTQTVFTSQGILMAEFIDDDNSSFSSLPATLLRNSLVTANLTFIRNDESVTFSNEVQVINVP